MKNTLSAIFIFVLILNVSSLKFKKQVKCLPINSFGCMRNSDCCASAQKKQVICCDMAQKVTRAGSNPLNNLCADSNPFQTNVQPQIMTYVSPNNIGGFSPKSTTTPSTSSTQTKAQTTSIKPPQFQTLSDVASYAATINGKNNTKEPVVTTPKSQTPTSKAPNVYLLSDLP
jgi:hypothetical protein